MLDFHLHVWQHEPGTPPPTFDLLASYCDAATDRGIDQIAITEHSHRFTRVAREVRPHWERSRSGPLADATDHVLDVEGGGDLDAYVGALVDAQRRGLPLLVGLEVDHLPGAGEAMAAVLADYPFDVLLGSVHWLDAWLFDDYFTPTFAREWQTRDASDVWSHYVDSVIELARSGYVDVLAHLDVIKVAGHRPPDIEDHMHRLIEALSETDIVIEFSSAGFRKPADETYPALDVLDRLVDAGLGLTTASDAHRVEDIGDRFDVLRSELDARGIDTLTTFDRRVARVHPR